MDNTKLYSQTYLGKYDIQSTHIRTKQPHKKGLF